MRSHVQPGLVAGADPIRFVSKHWGWLRALLILCLLFAVGATETEEIRFQTRQSKRPMRVRQWRHSHAGRRAVNLAAVEASSGETWDTSSAIVAWDGAQASDSSARLHRMVGLSQSTQAAIAGLVSLRIVELAGLPGPLFPPGISPNSNRAPPRTLL